MKLGHVEAGILFFPPNQMRQQRWWLATRNVYLKALSALYTLPTHFNVRHGSITSKQLGVLADLRSLSVVGLCFLDVSATEIKLSNRKEC